MATVSKTISLNKLFGKTENEARAYCTSIGMTMRITECDGVPLYHADDLIPNRINVGVANDLVVSIKGKG